MKSIKVKISAIKNNPDNPRLIKDDNFKKLVQSIKDFPEMMEIRPIVVNKKMIILGGNMRFRAAQEAGLKTIPIIVVNLSKDREREFIVKDNISGGDWDWDELANSWDTVKLEEWGLDIPKFDEVENDEIEPDEDGEYFLSIRCNNEGHAQTLYEKFLKQGLEVKIVT